MFERNKKISMNFHITTALTSIIAICITIIIFQVVDEKKNIKMYQSTIDKTDLTYYLLLDLDNDGQKELILSYVRGPDLMDKNKEVEIWGLKGKENIKIGTLKNKYAYMNILFNDKNHTVLYYQYGSGTDELEVYRIENKSLKLKRKIESYQPYHDPNDEGMNKNYTYYVDDKKISKKEMEKEWNILYKESSRLIFKKLKK